MIRASVEDHLAAIDGRPWYDPRSLAWTAFGIFLLLSYVPVLYLVSVWQRRKWPCRGCAHDRHEKGACAFYQTPGGGKGSQCDLPCGCMA